MDLKATLRADEGPGNHNEQILGMAGDHIGELTEMFFFRRRGKPGCLAGRGRKFEPPYVGCYESESGGGNSVVKDSFTTDVAGNRQGFLDSSNREEAAEKKLLKKPEGKRE